MTAVAFSGILGFGLGFGVVALIISLGDSEKGFPPVEIFPL